MNEAQIENERENVGFFRTKICTWPHLYDITILLGGYFFGSRLSDMLFGPIMGKDEAASPFIAWFYGIAFLLYIIGLVVYTRPLVNCVAVMGIKKPEFTHGDQAALVFTSSIFGVAITTVAVSQTGLTQANVELMAFILTAVFALFGGLFFFIHYRLMAKAGTGKGMKKSVYYIMMVAGYVLMYPFIIGIFSPVEALRMTMDIRLDSAPAAGFIDVFIKAGMRALLMGFIAWMIVYLFRRIAAVPFGVRGRGGVFFLELCIYYTLVLILQFYGLR